MKKHILAVIIASTVLAGCSSSSKPNDIPAPTEGTAEVIYNADLHAAAIIGDEGTNAIIIADGNGNAAVTVNGKAYAVQGNDLLDSQGNVIGNITTEDGTAVAHIGETTYTLTVIDGRLIIDSADFEPDFVGLRTGDAQFSFIDIETDGKNTENLICASVLTKSIIIITPVSQVQLT